MVKKKKPEPKKPLLNKWLKVGDQVVVISGNAAGQTGKVLHRTDSRIVVEGLNMRKKHLKKSEEAPQGRIAEFEAPIHASNVAACDGDGKRVKLRVRQGESGSKDLVYHQSGKDVVYRSLRAGTKGKK